MGSIEFKNKLVLRNKSFGLERRENLVKEVLSDSSPLPEPVNYEDIDKTFRDWVENDLAISYDGQRLPTFVLYSNQRFSEYMQMWEHVDDKKNPILNFKTITRESNPQSGTINGDSKNIPGERTYLMKRVEARDKNDRKYYIEYRMKQPMGVDFKFRISIMTNRYELINTFNQLIQEKFKAITAYIRPKGHFMSMNLDNISDESVYNIDDRQFYSQSCEITVKAYIIPEDYFIVEEKPALKLMTFDFEERKQTYADIEELPLECPENSYYYKPIQINVSLGPCDDKIKFTLDCNFTVEKYNVENIRTFIFKVNDEEIDLENILQSGNTLLLKENDEIKIKKVRRYDFDKCSFLKLSGYDKDIIYNENLDETNQNYAEEQNVSYDETECQK